MNLIMIISVSLSLCYSAHALTDPSDRETNRPEIHWLGFELAGVFSAGNGKGIADELTQFWQERLPAWAHGGIEIMPAGRILHGLINRRDRTLILPLKTPFPKGFSYPLPMSRTVHLFPPPGLVFRKSEMLSLFPNGVVSLNQFFGHPNRPVIAWVEGAVYHPLIKHRMDAALRNPAERDQVFLLSIGDSFEVLPRMAISNRIDAYFDHVVVYHNQVKHNSELSGLRFAHLAKVKTPVALRAYGNNTSDANKILDEINLISSTKEFLDLTEQLIQSYYPSEYQEEYLKKNLELLKQIDYSIDEAIQ